MKKCLTCTAYIVTMCWLGTNFCCGKCEKEYNSRDFAIGA